MRLKTTQMCLIILFLLFLVFIEYYMVNQSVYNVTFTIYPPFKYRSHILADHFSRCLLLTTERCVIITSSVGSYRSQYITISTRFTDAFLPSSPHNTSIRLALRRLCYRRCLIAGTYPSEAIIAASQCLSKR